MPDLIGAAARRVCTDLMDKCRLHTILRLPGGIFYAQGVKTNVLFFHRGATATRQTTEVWVYDLRNKLPPFGKRRPLTRDHLRDFEMAFGGDPLADPTQSSRAESERFHRYTREQIRGRNDSFDLVSHEDQSSNGRKSLQQPPQLISALLTRLQKALVETRKLQEQLAKS